MDSNTDTKGALSLRLREVAALAAEQERPASDVALELLGGEKARINSTDFWAGRASRNAEVANAQNDLGLVVTNAERLLEDKERLNAKLAAAEAAIDVLRQALYECYVATGADTDGDDARTMATAWRPYPRLVVEEVRRLRTEAEEVV